MSKKVYFLESCSTCKRIMSEVGVDESFEKQNIKEEKITAKQIEEMHKLFGSYESFFSRRAMKYRSLGLNEKQLSEADYKKYILEEYTFLKRPVFIINDKIFVGNTKKTVEAIKNELAK